MKAPKPNPKQPAKTVLAANEIPTNLAWWPGLGGTVLIGVAMLGCVAFTGPVPQMLYGHDLIALLDGGWRWHSGILPHYDYYAPLGSLSFLLISLGISIGGSLPQAMPAAVCLFGAFILLLMLYGAFSRMPPLPAALACVVVLATAITPHELRYESSAWSYAGYYNRWGYGLLCSMLIMVVAPPLHPCRRQEVADGAIVGFCAGLLIFLKISYGIVGMGVLAAQAVLCWKQWRRQAGTVLGFLLCLIMFGFLLHWAVRGFFNDMTMAFHARQHLDASSLINAASYIHGPLLVLAGFAVFNCVAVPSSPNGGLAWRILKTAFCATLFAASGVLVVMTNSPLGDLVECPVLPLGCLVFAGWILHDCRASAPKPALSKGRRLVIQLIVWIGVLLSTVQVTGRNLAGLVEAAKFKSSGQSLPADQVFADGPLKDIEIFQTGGDPQLPTSYVGKVNDGMGLLRQTGNLERHLVVLDFANPFDLVRQAKPCHGAPLVWQLGFVFSDRSIPPPEGVFNGADAVLIPKQFGDGNQDNLRVLAQHYGPYFQEHFVFTGQSRQWQLFTAKPPPTR